MRQMFSCGVIFAWAVVCSGQAVQKRLPKPANDACVKAASSTDDLDELTTSLLRFQRNTLDLSRGVLRSEDWEPSNALMEAAGNLGSYADWIADLGVIAVTMESQKDREFSRMVLGKTGHFVAAGILSVTIKQINLALSRIHNPAIVAEARALRDAGERLAALLKPCVDWSLSR